MTSELRTLLPFDQHENRRFELGVSTDGEVRILQTDDEPIAELVYVEGTLTIRDLGGSLAVLIDDVECRGRVALRNGNVIRIGDRTWTIDTLAEPVEPISTTHDGLGISLRDVRYEVRVGSNPLKGKKTLTLLDGVNLDIQPGEFVGIVGPSGSGKSTLIRVLNGDYVPDRKSVV